MVKRVCGLLCTFYFVSVHKLDFETMTRRLDEGYYNCVRLFIADVNRIFNNCKMYNDKNTEYVRCASSLEKFFYALMKEKRLWMELK